MPATHYLNRIVLLEQTDYDYVRSLAEVKGLGKKGFSAALRLIIREHRALQIQPIPQNPAASLTHLPAPLGKIDPKC